MLNKNVLAYCATAFASSMFGSIFGFYYVRTFLRIYHITEWWFNTAQILYMIWNAVNDPLFGYLQDSSKFKIFRMRSLAILFGGPIWALSFLLPWFPVFSHRPDWLTGLHLIFSLCFYDSLLTFVLLAHCALFTEISPSFDDRAVLLKYSQVASIIGSSAVFLADFMSNNQTDFLNFQLVCVLVAVLSSAAMLYTGLNVTVSQKYQPVLEEEKGFEIGQQLKSYWKLTSEIIRQKNFVAFVAMNFLQILHTTYNSNFFLIFAEELMEQVLPLMRSFLAGTTFMLPQIMVILADPLITKYGSYHMILYSFYIKLVLGVAMYLVGYDNIYLLAFFFVFDRSLPGATFSLFNMSVSDIIDEDMTMYNRKSAISSLVFGTNALFTKPAQSVAPMLVVAILAKYGYKSKEAGSESGVSGVAMKEVMFTFMCLFSIIVAILQILIWRCYDLRGHESKKKNTQKEAFLNNNV